MVKRMAMSLIEVLVAASMSVIIAGVIGGVFLDAWRSYNDQETLALMQKQSRLTVDEIIPNLKAAVQIAPSLADGSGNNYTSSADSLIIQVPAVDANDNIISTSNGTPGIEDPSLGPTSYDYLIYQRRPTDIKKIERIIIANPNSKRANFPSPLVLNSDTSEFTFHYFDSSQGELIPNVNSLTPTVKIKVKVVSSRASLTTTFSRAFESSATFRNTGVQ